MRTKIKDFTAQRNKLHLSLDELVEGLNRKLKGFKNYYQVSPMSKKWLNKIDWYVLERLTLFQNKKKNRRHKHARIKEVMKLTKNKLLKLAS
nr:group II intron maturase-specific domain-containing protein [Bacillus methanolicus]